MAEELNQIATAEPLVDAEAQVVDTTQVADTSTETQADETQVAETPQAFGWDEVDEEGNTVTQEKAEVVTEKAEPVAEPVKPTIEYVGLAPIVKDLGETERKALQYALQAGGTLADIVGKMQEFVEKAQPIDIATIDVTEYGNSQVRAVIAEEMRLRFPEMSQDDLELEIEDAANAFEDLSTNGKKKEYLKSIVAHVNENRSEKYKDLDGNILGTISTAVAPVEIPSLTREDVAEYLPEIVIERMEIKDGSKRLLKMPETEAIKVEQKITTAYEQDLAANTHYVNGKWEVDAAFNKEERITEWKRLYMGLYLYDNNAELNAQIIKKTKDEAIRSAGVGKIQRTEAAPINGAGGDSLFKRTQ